MSYTNNFSSKTSNLLQLTEIVTPKKLSKLDILDSNGTTKANQLYRLLTEGKITTEEGLMDALFDKGPHQRGNFNRVKRQLEEKLVNTLFLVDETRKKPTEIHEAYYRSYKYSVLVKILIGKRGRKAAISIAEKAYKSVEQYEFTDILLALSKDLRMHYGSIAGNKGKFSFYNEKTKYYSDVYMAELRAEQFFAEIALMALTSKTFISDQINIAISYAAALEELMLKYHSYKLNLFAYTAIALRFEIARDYKNTIKTCDRAINYFNQKKHLQSDLVIFTFLFRKLNSQYSLGIFSDTLKTAKKCIGYVKIGYFNWYRLQEILFTSHSYSGEYLKAYNTYIEAINHHDFSKQYQSIKEIWYIFEAYIYYLLLKKVFIGLPTERLKKFRLKKFLNEVPSYSKDKRGMNTAILILHVLFLLHQKQYDKIIDRTEALRTYTHRYLRQDETFRSNCFIKMLMQLPKANYHRAAVERKTKELREKLSSVGIIQNQSAEVEIVPYEVLWEFVLESLDNKIH